MNSRRKLEVTCASSAYLHHSNIEEREGNINNKNEQQKKHEGSSEHYIAPTVKGERDLVFPFGAHRRHRTLQQQGIQAPQQQQQQPQQRLQTD